MSKKRSSGTPKVTQMSFTMSIPGVVSPSSHLLTAAFETPRWEASAS